VSLIDQTPRRFQEIKMLSVEIFGLLDFGSVEHMFAQAVIINAKPAMIISARQSIIPETMSAAIKVQQISFSSGRIYEA
jgi:hypothetical protein